MGGRGREGPGAPVWRTPCSLGKPGGCIASSAAPSADLQDPCRPFCMSLPTPGAGHEGEDRHGSMLPGGHGGAGRSGVPGLAGRLGSQWSVHQAPCQLPEGMPVWSARGSWGEVSLTPLTSQAASQQTRREPPCVAGAAVGAAGGRRARLLGPRLPNQRQPSLSARPAKAENHVARAAPSAPVPCQVLH